MYHQNRQNPLSTYQARKFKLEKKTIANVNIEMENNRIRDVIGDHFIMKKQKIYHICIIWSTEAMNPLKQ